MTIVFAVATFVVDQIATIVIFATIVIGVATIVYIATIVITSRTISLVHAVTSAKMPQQGRM